MHPFSRPRERHRSADDNLFPNQTGPEIILAVGRDHFSDNPLRGELRLSHSQGRRNPEIFRREDDIPWCGKGEELLVFFLGSSEYDLQKGTQAEMTSDVQQNKIPMGIAGNICK